MLALPRPVLYGITFAAGGGLTVFGAAWFALLSGASPRARRGRTFGVVSAASNLGTIIGAMGASAIWQRGSLSAAVLAMIVPGLLAGLAMLVLPARASSSNSS